MSDHTTSAKRCTKCGKEYPRTIEYFHSSNKTKDGLIARCRECEKARLRDSAARRKDKQKVYSREYHKNNKERNYLTKRNWLERNKERRREYLRDYFTRYRKEHAKDTISRSARYRSKRLEHPADFSSAQWAACLDYFNHRCAVCDRPAGLWHKLAADHWIPLADSRTDNPGTVAWNIVPLCHGEGGCNNSKSNRNPHDWLIQTFGKRKAKAIEAKIEEYFEIVRKRKAGDA